jgi:hypothetical protein
MRMASAKTRAIISGLNNTYKMMQGNLASTPSTSAAFLSLLVWQHYIGGAIPSLDLGNFRRTKIVDTLSGVIHEFRDVSNRARRTHKGRMSQPVFLPVDTQHPSLHATTRRIIMNDHLSRLPCRRTACTIAWKPTLCFERGSV